MKKPEEKKPGLNNHMPSCQKPADEGEAEIEEEVEVEAKVKTEEILKFAADHKKEVCPLKTVLGLKDIAITVVIMGIEKEIVESFYESSHRRVKILAKKMVRPWLVCHQTCLVTHGEQECLHVGTHDVEWVIDTAASFHATPHQNLFTSYKSGDFGAVKMGNTSFSKIVGIGDVHITTNVGCALVLKDVRHVPDLRLNLISGTALDQQGYLNRFKEGTWKLSKGSLVVARGHICGTLYKTHAKLCHPSLNAVEEEISPNLWHRRLGHLSMKGLTTLTRKESISMGKGVALHPCEHCLFGKQHRVSFSSIRKNHSELLSLVHSDVCGPIEEESLGGSRYFVTFIDDASRKVWAYCLKSKD
ncbi:unnamed protein product [Cuscuta epithymum]|uniref:GAG-pre-integrase domain-containing protein n=1 Tax=Cuscuta epithymum TaxID=186058 RepID=A0AAV0DFG5_9ASTE|nr:unnamed protein product [Cuscuta epithymum]